MKICDLHFPLLNFVAGLVLEIASHTELSQSLLDSFPVPKKATTQAT